jgi:hypothetical protein
MGRIKLNDLQEESIITAAEMKKVFGGSGVATARINVNLKTVSGPSMGQDRMDDCVDCAAGACNYCETCRIGEDVSMISNAALTNSALNANVASKAMIR